MKSKKIPWWTPQVEKTDITYVRKALDTNFVNEGPLTREFERKIAAMVCARYAIATTSCTTALFLSLRAFGVRHGDEVIVPDMTFIATANAVDQAGGIPVFVDIDPKTLNMATVAM